MEQRDQLAGVSRQPIRVFSNYGADLPSTTGREQLL